MSCEQVLGLELSDAVRRLEQAGYTVVCEAVSSRKGMDGNEARVIRQREQGRCVKLMYSIFKTDYTYNGGG